jgi:hypothetical protein
MDLLLWRNIKICIRDLIIIDLNLRITPLYHQMDFCPRFTGAVIVKPQAATIKLPLSTIPKGPVVLVLHHY